MREYGIEDCELPRDVTWDMISNAVETRNSLQCRMKWCVKCYGTLCVAWIWPLRGGLGMNSGLFEVWDHSTSLCSPSLSLLRVMILSWKLKGGEAKWTAADDLRLIESLNEDEELEDEEDVDWERLSIDWPR